MDRISVSDKGINHSILMINIYIYICGGSAVSAEKAGSTEDTIYSDMVLLWLYKCPSLIEGETSFHLSV